MPVWKLLPDHRTNTCLVAGMKIVPDTPRVGIVPQPALSIISPAPCDVMPRKRPTKGSLSERSRASYRPLLPPASDSAYFSDCPTIQTIQYFRIRVGRAKHR